MPESKRTTSGVLGGLAGVVGLSAVAGVLVTATITPAIALSGAAASSAITLFDNLPAELDIDKLMLPTTLWAKNPDTDKYDVLTTFYDQNRSPVTYDGIAPVMYDAILSSEDPRYYQHGGVDLIGTTRAILSNLKGGGETQGGSSISQQYVKNVLVQRCESEAESTARDELTAEAQQTAEESGEEYVAPTADEISIRREQVNARCWSEATTSSGNEGIQRKLQEMRYAIALEQKYTKEDILLGYLNIANFGGITYGIDAAAQRYFGVDAKDLSIAQAATLAGIVQNPNTYRIDLPKGSITDADGNGYNKDPDGSIDDVNQGQLAALDSLLADGTITQEQYLAAADGYSATKGRQLYVLSRMLADGKITREQYVEAVIEPITPKITSPKTGCGQATGAEYFCQYVRSVIQNDPAFGETYDERTAILRQGGLNVYTTLDWNLQKVAQSTISDVAPRSLDGTQFGSSGVSIEASTGRVLTIAQNTKFSEANTGEPGTTSIVYAGNQRFGNSIGFEAGSTFKLFTLVDWLEQGHSVREVVNGADKYIKTFPASCMGGVWTDAAGYKPGNFGGVGGRIGTPMQFTASSLNSGYLAMAAELDLCDILDTAAKMGVGNLDGTPFKATGPNQVIGNNAVSPIAIAGAYATVANNGIYCEPQAIDRVTDSDGNEVAVPERSCSQVLDPAVAATAAYALQGVMAYGGTGAQGNPWDGTALIGKTGTHEQKQTWLVQSSTKVTTVAWVGNANGNANMFQNWNKYGTQLSQLRYVIGKAIQAEADRRYPAEAFPQPDANLTRQVLIDLPNVIGKSVDEATRILTDAGFEVIVGDAIDSSEGKGIIAAQDPGAGKVASGTVVTISPSNGKGVAIPDVSGMPLDDAISTLRGAGFGDVQAGRCTPDGSDSGGGDNGGGGPGNGNVGGFGTAIASGTRPGAGEVVNVNKSIKVDYTAAVCP